MRKIQHLLFALSFFLSVSAWFSQFSAPSRAAENTAQDRGLPILDLQLNTISLEELNAGEKQTKYPGCSLSLMTDQATESYLDVEVKGHGNTTWGMPKKAYQIKFAEKQNLFSMGDAKKWLLIANYLDASLLRNDYVNRLAAQISFPFANTGVFVDLYINGEYLGNYYLTHKVEIGEAAVDLQHPDGVLAEIDDAYADEPNFSSSVWQTTVSIKDVVDENAAEQASLSFQSAYERLEAALAALDWAAIQKEIDVPSFVQYYLLAELSANPDAVVSSCYLWRDGENDVIHAGPAWDYDMAFGNYDLYDASQYSSPGRLWHVSSRINCRMLEYLFQLPEFREEVRQAYADYFREAALRVLDELSETASGISASADADHALWNRGSHAAAVAELSDWIAARVALLDRVCLAETQTAPGSYRIAFAPNEGFSFQFADASSESGANLQLYKTDGAGSEAQTWELIRLFNGFWVVRNLLSQKVLTVQNNDPLALAANLYQQPWADSRKQQWMLLAEDDHYYLMSAYNGLFADLEGNSFTSDANIRVYPMDTGRQQRIALIPVSDDTGDEPSVSDGWVRIGGKEYWYERGVRQGTTGRGKEIYDPDSDAWYWLDAVQNGAKAVSKDVYQPYTYYGQDSIGKWVRYDAQGHMIKGWSDDGRYFFDTQTGAMAKDVCCIDGTVYLFDTDYGILLQKNAVLPWIYWYENGARQGMTGRGKEIYDPAADAWFWLDAVMQGAKAIDKEVYMPYIYSNVPVKNPDTDGKWVRYDRQGAMVKGWFTDAEENRYYYHPTTGAMLKGTHTINGTRCTFDPVSGILQQPSAQTGTDGNRTTSR